MFKDLLYYNQDSVTKYYELLTGKPLVNQQNVKEQKYTGGDIKIAQAKKASEITYSTVNRDEFICTQFENELESRTLNEYFFDFMDGDPDISTIPRGSIIRFDGDLDTATFTEQLEMIRRFASLMPPEITSDSDVPFDSIMNLMNESKKLPLQIIEANFQAEEIYNVVAKINQEHLKVDMSDLIEEEDVTIIGRILKHTKKGKFMYFDVLKDIFGIGRRLRRELSKQNDHKLILEDFNVSAPVIELEIIAIYR